MIVVRRLIKRRNAGGITGFKVFKKNNIFLINSVDIIARTMVYYFLSLREQQIATKWKCN